MARSVRAVSLVSILLTAALAVLTMGSSWAEILIYDSSADNFASWQTNHPSKLYWNASAGAYHYALTDAADDYAFAALPYPGGSFRLEFDWLPTNTGWAGNLRLGLWDSEMRANWGSAVYANFGLDDNGYHLIMEVSWPVGGTALDLGGFADGQWYHTTIAYSQQERTASLTVVRASDNVTVSATAHGVGEPMGIDRIAVTSIGDSAYPGSTAEGFIRNVKLFATAVGGDSVVFDSPSNGARFMLPSRALLPIKFHLVDAQGNPIMEQREVTLEVTEVSSPTIRTTYLFSAATGNLQFSTLRGPQYIASFRRVTIWTWGGGACTAVVKENGQPIGSIAFNISSMYSRLPR